jgi:hypothetical protein
LGGVSGDGGWFASCFQTIDFLMAYAQIDHPRRKTGFDDLFNRILEGGR